MKNKNTTQCCSYRQSWELLKVLLAINYLLLKLLLVGAQLILVPH